MSDLINSILNNPERVAAWIAVLGGMLGFVKAFLAWRQSARGKQIASYAHMAFHAVEELDRLAPNKYTDSAAKLADYLDKLDNALDANGAAPLSGSERSLAADMAGALNSVQAAAPSVPNP